MSCRKLCKWICGAGPGGQDCGWNRAQSKSASLSLRRLNQRIESNHISIQVVFARRGRKMSEICFRPFKVNWRRTRRYLQSCRPRCSSWAAPAEWVPPRCWSADCARSCVGWRWTCSRSRPGMSPRSGTAAPPCSRCSPPPGWWSSSPGRTRRRPAARKRKRRMGFGCKGGEAMSMAVRMEGGEREGQERVI